MFDEFHCITSFVKHNFINFFVKHNFTIFVNHKLKSLALGHPPMSSLSRSKFMLFKITEWLEFSNHIISCTI